MTDRARLRIFLVAGLIFFAIYCYAAKNLPPWGQYRGPYGDVVTGLAVYERHATDTVNAINYDYRGFDTLGEEFILFAAVVGVLLLLRREPGADVKAVGKVQDRPALSPAIREVALPAVAVTVLFGLYLATHGQLTPGGGFQGGVILATAPLVVYLAENTQAFEHITSHAVIEVVEAAGAGSYALIGFMPLLFGLPFLTNILPLGVTGDVFSAGNIDLISVCVGVEVTAAFLLVAYTYLEEIITGQIPED